MVRIKNRYLLLNILYPAHNSSSALQPLPSIASKSSTPAHFDAGRFVVLLRAQIALLFGDFGLGASLGSLKVIYFSAATSTAILRVPRNHHRLVWAALTHITEVPAKRRGDPGKPCVVRVVRVSGTIRKAEEELLRRSRKDVVRAKLAQEGKELDLLEKTLGTTKRAMREVARGDDDVGNIEDLSGSAEEMSD